MNFHFQNAVRNAIKVRKSSTDAAPLPMHENPEVSGIFKRLFATLRRIIVSIIRGPAGRVRRYLIGGVQLKLDSMHDAAQARLDAIHIQLEEQQIRLEEQQKKLNEFIGIVQSRLDDVSLKVRAPIAVDESTYAVRVTDGYISVPREDTTLLVMLADASVGGLEPGTRDVLMKLLAPGMTLVDVGASVGLLTLPAARKVGPQGRVYAFEPTPTTFMHLMRTIGMNDIGNIVIAQQLAIGAAPGQQKLHLHAISGHNSLFGPSSDEQMNTVDVAVSTLDMLIPPDRKVDVVKIDVEGAELDVLSGMKRIIFENADIVLIAEFGSSHLQRINVSPKQWFQAFEELGFTSYAIDELTGRCRAVSHRDVADMVSVNIAFARAHQADRLSS